MSDCTITLGTDCLRLSIPSEVEDRIQTVLIPPTEDGMRVLLRILRARNEAPGLNGRKLNTDSEPTQALVREWLRADREAKTKQAQEDILGKLDFNVEVNL